MKLTERVLQTISQKLALPAEMLSGDPIVELKGRQEVTVLHHRGVVGYTADCICVAAGSGCVRICGSGLQVYRMNRERIVVYGSVEKVLLGEDGG